MKTTYRVTDSDGIRLFDFSGDFAQASSPILMNDSVTPMQVAQAQHDVCNAAIMLAVWACNEGGDDLRKQHLTITEVVEPYKVIRRVINDVPTDEYFDDYELWDLEKFAKRYRELPQTISVLVHESKTDYDDDVYIDAKLDGDEYWINQDVVAHVVDASVADASVDKPTVWKVFIA